MQMTISSLTCRALRDRLIGVTSPDTHTCSPALGLLLELNISI